MYGFKSGRALAQSLLGALLMIAGPTLIGVTSAPSMARAQASNTLEDVRDQGVLYFKKGIYKQAKVRLDRAYKNAKGKQDFLTVYYRAMTYYKMLLLETAFQMVNEAAPLAGDDARRASKVAELKSEMDSLYGGVTFKAAKGETNAKGRIFFEAKTGIINKSKKKRFNAIRERFRSTDIKLPTTIYLPYGAYTANKVPFELQPGAEKQPVLEIFLQVVVEEDDGMGVWGWVGIGVGAAAAVGGVIFAVTSDSGGTTLPRQSEIIF